MRLRLSNPTHSTRVVTLSNFPPGELSLHAVEARGRIHIEQALTEQLRDAGCCRVKVSITWMVTKGDGEELVPFSMSLNILQLLESSRSTATSLHVRELLNRIDAQVKAKMEFAETHESKIVFRSISEVQLLFAPDRRCQQHNHLHAGSDSVQPVQGSGQGSGGSNGAVLPIGLRERRCCLNILNNDDYCFRYAMIAWRGGYAGRKNASRPSQYLTNAPAGGRWPAGFRPKFIDCGLNFDMLQYPVRIEDLKPFEDRNNVGVYVYEWHDNHAALVRRPTVVRSREDEVVLLLHEDHWVLVTKTRTFLAGPGQKRQRVCYRCGGVSWHTDEHLDKHLDAGKCLEDVTHQPLGYRLPSEKASALRFQKFEHQLAHPIVAYCDFETRQTVMQPEEEPNDDGDGPKPPRGLGVSRLVAENNGVASYGYCLVSSVPDIPTSVRIARDNAVEFVKELVNVGQRYEEIASNPVPIIWSPELENEFQQCTACYLCGGRKSDTRPLVRDHAHLTGVFRGARLGFRRTL